MQEKTWATATPSRFHCAKNNAGHRVPALVVLVSVPSVPSRALPSPCLVRERRGAGLVQCPMLPTDTGHCALAWLRQAARGWGGCAVNLGAGRHPHLKATARTDRGTLLEAASLQGLPLALLPCLKTHNPCKAKG